MRGGEIGLAVDPAIGLEIGERAPARFLQRRVDQLARRHGKAGMRGAEPLRQGSDNLVIGAALARRLDQFRAEQNVLAAAGGIKSSCSRNMVAGSTTSATFAVSVMNCSCTQTNR